MASGTRKYTSFNTKSFQLSNRANCGSVYADLPADIFFKICSYLDLEEICRIGGVCMRWYLLTRSEFVWHSIDIPRLAQTPEKMEKLVSSLPSCVEEIRIGYPQRDRQHIWLPGLFIDLRRRCPHLSTLIIDNALLAKPNMSYYNFPGYMLNCKVPEKEQIIRYYCNLQCTSPDTDDDLEEFYDLLRNLTMLSLRKSVFVVENVISSQLTSSKIKVLDATRSLSITDKAVQLLHRLPYLEELYLPETAITVNGVLVILSTLPCLKVIDLDRTVVGGETFSILKERGRTLTELYMGGTAVKDEDLLDVSESCFQNLEKVCLKFTRVTEVGIEKLLDKVRSLTCIIVTGSDVKLGWIVDQHISLRKRLLYEHNQDKIDYRADCEHFFENKYRGNFRNFHTSFFDKK